MRSYGRTGAEIGPDDHDDAGDQRQEVGDDQRDVLKRDGQQRIAVSLVGDPLSRFFELVAPRVDGGPPLLELGGQTLLRADQVLPCLGVAGDQFLASLGQLPTLLDDSLRLPGIGLVLLGLLFPALPRGLIEIKRQEA
jgi:hypothetical protein